MFGWFASDAIAAIALHNCMREGGGSNATLNGGRLNISPDNIQLKTGRAAHGAQTRRVFDLGSTALSRAVYLEHDSYVNVFTI